MEKSVLRQLKAAIRRWCEDEDQTPPIEFICDTLEPLVDQGLCDHKFVDSKRCLKCGWTSK